MWTYEKVIDQKNKIEKITEENDKELYSILYSIKEIIKPFIKKEKYEMDKKRRRNYHPLKPKPDILNRAEKSKDDAIKDQMLGELNKLSNKNFDKNKIIQKIEEYLGNILDDNDQKITKNILNNLVNSLIKTKIVQLTNKLYKC